MIHFYIILARCFQSFFLLECMCSLFFIWGGKLFPILQLDIYFKTHPTSPPRCLPDLMHCEHLKRLSLDGNRLRELPELPVSLEKISLQDNCLTLPGSVFWEMLVASGLGLVVFLYIYTNIFVGKEVNSENGKLNVWKYGKFHDPLLGAFGGGKII